MFKSLQALKILNTYIFFKVANFLYWVKYVYIIITNLMSHRIIISHRHATVNPVFHLQFQEDNGSTSIRKQLQLY